MDGRPTIKALVAFQLHNGDSIVRKELVDLADVPDFLNYGWCALLDPSSEAELVRWLQLNRTPDKRTRW